jgi:hypothetical protein
VGGKLMTLSLMQLMNTFIVGGDTSLKCANAIEFEIDNLFPDDNYMQDTVEMLAMYRPGGGEFLFDTPVIKKRLAETIQYIDRISEK